MPICKHANSELFRPGGVARSAMWRFGLGIVLFIGVVSTASAENFEWRRGTPESQGMSSRRLEELQKGLAPSTRCLLVIRNDHIVHEWYEPGRTAADKHGTASLAKAIVGGLALSVAVQDGLIKLDDPVAKYVPAWKDDPTRAKITVRQLGSHTSGMADASLEGTPHDQLPGWMGDFWKRLDPPKDPFTLARDTTPLPFEPGAKFQYSDPGIAMLAYATTAAIREAPVRELRTLLRDRIMRHVGIADNEWSVGYGQTVTVDGLPLVPTWGGAAFSPRAAARIGRLVLRGGDWNGQQLITPAVMRQIVNDAGLPGSCGMGWWTNADGRFPKLPKDAVWGSGAGDQHLLVVPSLRLIAVRNGSALPGSSAIVGRPDHDIRNRIFFEPLIASVTQAELPSPPPATAAAPYPPSTVIAKLEWAASDTIRRRAVGSDNWPLTWADDGHLYGAYGDGSGFEPLIETKLSLGLARITGGPNDFQGLNFRSPMAESMGGGAQGLKASGMLMVDGTLYMWLRNAANSQLAWSDDHGQTWTKAPWKWTTSFGCPTFLNFGQNYSGARDNYVYIYSLDSDNAYVPADRMILTRVTKGQLRQREFYEFLADASDASSPRWTSDLAARGSAFTHPGRCYRSGVTYNAALKCYLWCQVYPESRDARGPRYQGGFGVYDAPEPWGPWTTVFHTNEWDVGPGETCSFPTKWTGSDGLTMWLVFSGDDCFSVRRASLVLRNETK